MSQSLATIEYRAQRIAAQMTESLQRRQLTTLDNKPVFVDCVKVGRYILFQVESRSLSKPVDVVLSKQYLGDLEAKIKLPVHKVSLRYPLPGLSAGRYIAVELSRPVELPKVARLELEQNTAPLMVPIGFKPEAQWASLPALGHTLVAGSTGMGKTSFLHACIASALSYTTIHDLRAVLLDVKGAEFPMWKDAPHIIDSVCTTPHDCGQALALLVDEITKRNKIFSEAGVRDIASYRQAGHAMPFVWVIVDEVLDMIGRSDKTDAVPDSLKSIASTGRSAGVILWLATQHSTKEAGLPRVVSVNISTRFIFRMGDAMAAASTGVKQAYRLPPIPGRMYVKRGDDLVLAQAPHLPEKDINDIAMKLSAKSQSPLSDVEKELVKYAVEKLYGQFIVNQLWDAFKPRVSHSKISKLGKTWELKGWLTKPRHATDSRKVTDTLLGFL